MVYEEQVIEVLLRDLQTSASGAELDPRPPVGFKDPGARALHVHEDDELDEAQLVSWLERAASIPGWIP